MSWRDIVLRLRSLVLPRRMDAELQEELDFHLEMQTRKIRNSEGDEAGAQRRARLQFGSVVTATEQCREQRGISTIE